MTQWPPAYMSDLNTTNYGMWNAPDPALLPNGQVVPGEGGVDLSTPIGTPVYALADGPLVAAGYFRDNAHGVITQRVNVPGVGLNDLYYQHIQLDHGIQQCMTGQCNQYIMKGQRIGTIGPFNEIELGFNSRWGSVWGTNHPSNVWPADPRPWLRALLSGTAPSPGSITGTGASSTTGFDPLAPLTNLIGQLGGLWAWLSNPMRVAKMVVGIMLIVLALYLLIVPEESNKVIQFVKAHPEVLAL